MVFCKGRKTPSRQRYVWSLRSALALSVLALILIGNSGCGSEATNPVSSPTGSRPTAAPPTFGLELNSTSVFIGASIVQYWPLPLNNKGISGQTTSQVLARFKSDVLGHGYTRVIILCGTNDILQNKPNLTKELTGNLNAMGEIARGDGIEVVLSELPPAVSGSTDLTPVVAAVNASIARLAKQRKYLLVDYFTPMRGHPEYFVDGIHPNAEGYAVMEKELSAVVVR